MSSAYVDMVRALSLIPYFSRREGQDHTLFEAADNLGMSYSDLIASLNRLHTSGVGIHTEDLFDLALSHSRTRVHIIEDQGIVQPLRLTSVEAIALLLTLEVLESQLPDNDAIRSAAAKLRAATGWRTRALYDANVELDNPHYAPLHQSLNQQRQLRFRYFSPAKNETTERVVDPVRLYVHDGDTYLHAWDTRAEDFRSFKVKRMDEPRVLEAPAVDHSKVVPANPFVFGHRVDVFIAPEATWLADYYELTIGARDEETGWFAAELRYGSEDWLVRFLLSHGDRLRLRGDATELHKKVAHRARRGLAGYNN